MFETFFRKLVTPADTKIVMVILDGLGGLPREPGGKTELETAHTPHLDALATRSSLGLTIPIGPGITTGSGPGHLAIFGYNPLEYEIGRGVIEALGVDFEIGPDDVAARGNFCTIDKDDILTDRRAGRLPSEDSRKLVELLREIKIDGVDIFVEPIREHRFVFIMRAPGLGANLTDMDPQKTGAAPLAVKATHPNSESAASYANQFAQHARRLLTGKSPANMIMLRGFAKFPSMPQFSEIYKLHPASIAVHGMYRGVSRLVGMEVLDVAGKELEDGFDCLERHWGEHDFFYLHFKKTDTCGESGDFDGKVKAIEEFDAQLPRLLDIKPDVIVIGGDHSSPAEMKSHSWHPVPLLIWSKYARPDGISEFGERACAHGSLGVIPARHVMPLALANAGRVTKIGA